MDLPKVKSLTSSTWWCWKSDRGQPAAEPAQDAASSMVTDAHGIISINTCMFTFDYVDIYTPKETVDSRGVKTCSFLLSLLPQQFAALSRHRINTWMSKYKWTGAVNIDCWVRPLPCCACFAFLILRTTCWATSSWFFNLKKPRDMPEVRCEWGGEKAEGAWIHRVWHQSSALCNPPCCLFLPFIPSFPYTSPNIFHPFFLLLGPWTRFSTPQVIGGFSASRKPGWSPLKGKVGCGYLVPVSLNLNTWFDHWMIAGIFGIFSKVELFFFVLHFFRNVFWRLGFHIFICRFRSTVSSWINLYGRRGSGGRRFCSAGNT